MISGQNPRCQKGSYNFLQLVQCFVESMSKKSFTAPRRVSLNNRIHSNDANLCSSCILFKCGFAKRLAIKVVADIYSRLSKGYFDQNTTSPNLQR